MVFILEIICEKKDGAYVTSLGTNIGTYWIELYVLNNNVTDFDSFGAEHVPKEIKHLSEIKA